MDEDSVKLSILGPLRSDDVLTTIILIRHGKTDEQEKIVQGGRTNTHLGELGRQQANDLAEELKKYGIQEIYLSSLYRQRETAVPFITATSFPMSNVHETDDLKERDYGHEFDGKPAELYSEWKKTMGYNDVVNFDYTPPGGESVNGGLKDRARKVVTHITEKENGKTTAIFGSHGILTMIQLVLFNETAEERYSFYGPKNASVTVIKIRNNVPQLAVHNYTGHLTSSKDKDPTPLISEAMAKKAKAPA